MKNELLRHETSAGAWQLFCRTGLPEAYLAYAVEKEREAPH